MRRSLDLADPRGPDADHQADLLEVHFLNVIQLNDQRLALGQSGDRGDQRGAFLAF